MVYEHPTIASLALHVSASVSGADDGSGKGLDQKRRELHALVDKYTQNIPIVTEDRSVGNATEKVVFLTGGTGSLGANILARLLECKDVSKIYACSRNIGASASSSKERHARAFEKEGIPMDKLEDTRIDFLDGDTSLEGFGVLPTIFERVSDVFSKWTWSNRLVIAPRRSYTYNPQR